MDLLIAKVFNCVLGTLPILIGGISVLILVLISHKYIEPLQFSLVLEVFSDLLVRNRYCEVRKIYFSTKLVVYIFLFGIHLFRFWIFSAGLSHWWLEWPSFIVCSFRLFVFWFNLLKWIFNFFFNFRRRFRLNLFIAVLNVSNQTHNSVFGSNFDIHFL